MKTKDYSPMILTLWSMVVSDSAQVDSRFIVMREEVLSDLSMETRSQELQVKFTIRSHIL